MFSARVASALWPGFWGFAGKACVRLANLVAMSPTLIT
jgi:hypothetical protein